jgi:cytochrome c
MVMRTTPSILLVPFVVAIAASAGACGSSCPEPTAAPLASSSAQAPSAESLTGNAAAAAALAQWRSEHPDRNWETNVRERHGLEPAADNSHLIGSSQGATYGEISERDVLTWKRETEKMALAGSRVFHSAQELGSTNGVSCDMCHPHASNTHPETYPKFQEQLGRVVLLRDIINWCIEQPLRGKPLAADDPKMRALEAYILAQRKGVALEYGKR